MRTAEELRRSLERLDGRGYKAYKAVAGPCAIGELTLFIDHVQGDPFASPSKLRLRVPHAMSPALFSSRVRRVALADYLARRLRDAIPTRRGRRGIARPPPFGSSSSSCTPSRARAR